jgi:hypothetical protein
MRTIKDVTHPGRKRIGLDEDSRVLVCTAPHPRAEDGDVRFAGRIHGVRLQQVPFLVRATYREVRDWADARSGCLVVRCSSSDCRAFSEYEIVGPVRTARGAVLPSLSEPGARAPSGEGTVAPLRALKVMASVARSFPSRLAATTTPRTSPTP